MDEHNHQDSHELQGVVDVPRDAVDIELGPLHPNDTFDYPSLNDRPLAMELREYPARIYASRRRALTEVCNIGRWLANARRKLKGRFREWCEKALQDGGKSTAYSDIAIFEKYDHLCPIVGHINKTTLGTLAGPQFADLRGSVITRLQDGKLLTSKDVREEMASVRAARKAERASATRQTTASGDVDGAPDTATSTSRNLDSLVDVLERFIPLEAQETVISLIEQADANLLRDHYFARQKSVPGSY